MDKDKVGDRFAMWALRSVATAMVFAGVSVLVAGVPLFGMFPEAPVARTIAGFLFQLSGLFVVSGATAMYLSRARAPGLPNERATTSDAERPRVGGWLIVMAIVLVTLPVWLLLRLQPFLAEWSRVADVLSTFDMWEGANANMSGIVLVPLAGALTPPLFELAALLTFIVAPAVLLPLLFTRSRRFPRIYIVCSVLLSALVIASLRGADAALLAGEAAQQFIEGSSARAEEEGQLTGILARYTRIVGSTAPVLAWALCGYLGWVPGMIFSRRVRTTFASRIDSRDTASATAFDIEAITSPPRFPG
jgi:hypothetical protein